MAEASLCGNTERKHNSVNKRTIGEIMGKKEFLSEDARRNTQVAELQEQRIKELESALRSVIKHQEIMGGDLAKMSTTWSIANAALTAQ